MTPAGKWQPYRLSGWLAIGICVAIAALAFLGLRASRDFRRSSLQLAQRRADEGARLLSVALVRDMRAAENSVLSSPAWDEFGVDAQETLRLVASAFARYPYPEVFFAWKAGQPAEETVFFTRSDRPPPWIRQKQDEPNWYPVRLESDATLATTIVERLRGRAGATGALVSGLDVNGVPYQLVARLDRQDDLLQQAEGAHGFLVNMPWAREHYFSELTAQVLKITPDGSGVAFSILDDRGGPVVGDESGAGVVSRRAFPLAFFDPLQSHPSNLALPNWTIVASAAVNPVSPFPSTGLDFALAIAALAAVALAVSLVVTARAMRASAQLAEMRADFMSSVTHELKTPIASIRAMTDTLMRGRLRDSEARQEYAAVVAQEAVRLSRLVDNVLAYSRITDVADVYYFERVDMEELIGTVLRRFTHQLRGFEVSMDVRSDFPAIQADRSAMELLLDNLIDNAIRYSKAVKALDVATSCEGDTVRISVSDRGIGIPPEELSQVTGKFFRGRNTRTQGSGLGLAIVERIARDHGGALSIRSREDGGTSVEVTLHAAPGDLSGARTGPAGPKAGFRRPAWTLRPWALVRTKSK